MSFENTHTLSGTVNKLFVLSVSHCHSVRVPSLCPWYETPSPLCLGLRLSEAVPDRAPQLQRKLSGVKVPAIVTLCFSLERLLSFPASGSARGETKICWWLAAAKKLRPGDSQQLTCKIWSKLERTRCEPGWWRMWLWVMTAGCARWQGRCSFLFVISKPFYSSSSVSLKPCAFSFLCSFFFFFLRVTLMLLHGSDWANANGDNKSQQNIERTLGCSHCARWYTLFT